MRLNLGIKRWTRKALAIAELGLLSKPSISPPLSYVQPAVVVLLIYRSRNSPLVERLIHHLGQSRVRIKLWALDDVTPTLAPWTVGQGPGQRNDLLNKLHVVGAVQPQEFIMISDDDVEFPLGNVELFIFLAIAGGFMISQPAHLHDSFYSFGYTCVRPYLVARFTRFVEVGPLILIHPRFQARVFPMRIEFGMGWASTIEWHQNLQRGESFGIVDAVGIRHCSPVGLDYDTNQERVHLRSMLTKAGLNSVDDILITTKSWYRWGSSNLSASSNLTTS